MNKHITSSVARKREKLHYVPKWSTEAQIVLQEIRSVNGQTQERTDLAPELQLVVVSPINSTADKLANVTSNTQISNASIHYNGTQELSEVARLKDMEYPFVITSPGFDIRYNMTALRPLRESPQERERNICIQKKSIAKCKEWLEKS